MDFKFLPPDSAPLSQARFNIFPRVVCAMAPPLLFFRSIVPPHPFAELWAVSLPAPPCLLSIFFLFSSLFHFVASVRSLYFFKSQPQRYFAETPRLPLSECATCEDISDPLLFFRIVLISCRPLLLKTSSPCNISLNQRCLLREYGAFRICNSLPSSLRANLFCFQTQRFLPSRLFPSRPGNTTPPPSISLFYLARIKGRFWNF